MSSKGSPIILSSSSESEQESPAQSEDLGPPLDISLLALPPIFIIPTRLSPTDLTELKEQLDAANATVVDDPQQARLFLGHIHTSKRAAFELRGQGIFTEPVDHESRVAVWQDTGLITVVKLSWWEECLKEDAVQSVEPYIIYCGRQTEQASPQGVKRQREPTAAELVQERDVKRKRILERAMKDAERTDSRIRGGHGPPWEKSRTTEHGDVKPTRPELHRKTTSEYDREKSIQNQVQPRYVREQLRLAVHRPHRLNPPNSLFIDQLQTIKLSRILSLDDIGIRAYSTAIAAVIAYPYEITTSSTILTLPGCDGKTSALFYEWYNSSPNSPKKRRIRAVQELESSEEFQCLKTFYNIWGVGAKTAREFYHQKGWRTLDDVIEFGWTQLTRVQQIGLKFYDELNFHPIPRSEVSQIGAKVGEIANILRPGYEYILTGGYRRGKPLSGDVDLIISHRDEEQTKGGFLTLLVTELENQGFVTHTLYLGRGGGFGTKRVGDGPPPSVHPQDELEKAMLIWQDPSSSPDEKNRNPHRRLDIILSPPSCVGTAILGWTGGTTYERDLRRFVEKEKGWKFDSGGVWERGSGRRLEIGEWGEGETLVECEKRCIEMMGLEYWRPEERNTG